MECRLAIAGWLLCPAFFSSGVSPTCGNGSYRNDGTGQKRPRTASRDNPRHGMRGADEQDCGKELTGECDDF